MLDLDRTLLAMVMFSGVALAQAEHIVLRRKVGEADHLGSISAEIGLSWLDVGALLSVAGIAMVVVDRLYEVLF